MSYFKDRKNALTIALSGIVQAFKTETHLKLHVVAALVVISSAFFFNVSKIDWIILLLSITLVISFEMFNSVIEKLCDLIMPEQNSKIKYIKDAAAGAVLIACIFAVIAGIIVFLPYFNK